MILHLHAAATSSTKGQTLDQRWAFARRSPLPGAPILRGVFLQPLLILLILFPADIAGMRVGNERMPSSGAGFFLVCFTKPLGSFRDRVRPKP